MHGYSALIFELLVTNVYKLPYHILTSLNSELFTSDGHDPSSNSRSITFIPFYSNTSVVYKGLLSLITAVILSFLKFSMNASGGSPSFFFYVGDEKAMILPGITQFMSPTSSLWKFSYYL